MPETITIVGANAAGAAGALALRAGGFEGPIHLVGAEEHLPYERPTVSKDLLLGTKAPDGAALYPSAAFEQHDIELHLGTTVSELRLDDRSVILADGGRLPADQVLLATGGRPRRLGVAGGDLPGVHHVRTIDDAVAIREDLLDGGPIVVVGGGFVGAEVAAAARTLGNEVTIVTLDPMLARNLGGEVARRVADAHRANGVRVLEGIGIDRIEGDHRVRRVVTDRGEVLDATAVVVGIGMEPAVELARHAGLAVDDGIVVDTWCRTSHPAVFAAGDVARAPNRRLGRSVRLEHLHNAQGQGAAAARAMLGQGADYDDLPWFWSDQYDLRLQAAGLAHPDDELLWRQHADEGSFSVLFLRGDVIAAVIGVGTPGDVRGAMALIEAGASVPRDELADVGVDLRALARQHRRPAAPA